MLERLKQTLVDSFIGAIALGWLLAQSILHFVNIFATPVVAWISRREYGRLTDRPSALASFSLQDAWPEAIRFSLLLLVWYILLRWLYVKPVAKRAPDSTTEAR